MASSTSSNHCLNCDEEEDIYQCKGCSNTFCFDCLIKHRDKMNENLNELQNNYNLFKQNINDQKDSSLIQQINKWEQQSIEKIKQIAKKCREKIINPIINIENKLNDLSEQTKQIKKGNKINESLLYEINQKLINLKKQINKQSNISIRQQQSNSFINQIFISRQLSKDDQWIQNGITVAGGNGEGSQLNQLYRPLMCWYEGDKEGRIVVGGNGQGKQSDQLSFPRGLSFDIEGNLYVVDWGWDRIQKFEIDLN